ncbi:hypothetical protein [Ottowia sp.]|uniref:hypothetical protein n=1 Tax=Ottowia sp. TaxID=1898956 RepID=UPI0025D81029|nr:hypothetical protein [Ottowia sp.]
MTPNLRLVRSAPDPLGLYIRVARVGSPELQSFIATRHIQFTGVVLEAKLVKHQKELLTLAQERRIDVVLDPMTAAMATPGGYRSSMKDLPWAKDRPHTVQDFQTAFAQRQCAEGLAAFAMDNGFSQVLAPTHLITEVESPWLPIDIALASNLRDALDRNGGGAIEVLYPLTISYEIFRTPAKRLAVIEWLRAANVQGLWLNVAGCGADSNATQIVRYCDAATDFQALGVPIVADHVGGIPGLSLMAFGGVGGIAHGITLSERLEVSNWRKPPSGRGFSPKVRVYIPQIDMSLPRDDAERFFEAGGGKARARFGCHDAHCCPRGVEDMCAMPERHFLHQRSQQVAALGQIPETLRPSWFLEDHIRPASDVAMIAKQMSLPEDLLKKMQVKAKGLNTLRTTLGPYAKERREKSLASHPKTRIARVGNG